MFKKAQNHDISIIIILSLFIILSFLGYCVIVSRHCVIVIVKVGLLLGYCVIVSRHSVIVIVKVGYCVIV